MAIDLQASGGIPSSVRNTPSGAVVWAVQELKRLGMPLRTALDLGCGKGRNSLYLAAQGLHVTAMDFTSSAIDHLRAMASERGLADSVRAILCDVTEPWPVAHDSIDLVIDAFCFRHIAPQAARDVYRQQLLRALRTRGHYLLSFASIGDGYYGTYVTAHNKDGDERLAVDSIHGAESVLTSRRHVVRYFAPDLLSFEGLDNATPLLPGDSQESYDDTPNGTYAVMFRRNPHRS